MHRPSGSSNSGNNNQRGGGPPRRGGNPQQGPRGHFGQGPGQGPGQGQGGGYGRGQDRGPNPNQGPGPGYGQGADQRGYQDGSQGGDQRPNDGLNQGQFGDPDRGPDRGPSRGSYYDRPNDRHDAGPPKRMPQKAEIDLISLIPIDLEPVPMPEDVAALLAENSIELEPGDSEKMGKFLAMLLIANDSMNLTAVTDPATGWRRHIADALMLLPTIASFEPAEFVDADADPDVVLAALKRDPADAEPRIMKLVDVGTGGGLPGIPLAIALPDVHVTLMEATGKKVQFLRLVKKRLALKNVDVVHVRAEAAGQDHKNHRERYDIAVARAVGSLAVLVELVGPLVKVGGLMLAVKGEKAEEEVALAAEAIEKIGLAVDHVLPTPTSRLVLMPKVSRTPRTYPRRDGEPSRVPIGIKREDKEDRDNRKAAELREKSYGGDGPPRDGTPRGTRPGGGGIGGGPFGEGRYKNPPGDGGSSR